jgi:hypothetical protein
MLITSRFRRGPDPVALWPLADQREVSKYVSYSPKAESDTLVAAAIEE